MPSRLLSLFPISAYALAACLAACAGAAPAAQIPDAVSRPEPRELDAREQVVHALNRLTFGSRPGDASRVQAMGVDRWIDMQLHPERIDDSAAENFLGRYQTLRMSSAQLYQEFPPAAVVRQVARRDSLQRAGRMTPRDSMEIVREARRSNQFVAELTSSRVARAVVSERQLQEVMVDFWENHFTVFVGKGQTRWFLTSFDRDVIRPNALGHYRDLLGAVAKSPAMLFYLDNVQSVADSTRATLRASRGGSRPQRTGTRRRPGRPGVPIGSRPGVGRARNAPVPGSPGPVPAGPARVAQRRPRGLNENYARELMELHTLGVDGGYTQHDVVEVARALTGWSIRPARALALADANPRARRALARLERDGEPGTFVFRPELHDAEAKVVLGHTLEAGRGIEDGEDVLDILARHPSTARFIARKLAVRFVSDEPPQALVDRAAATFLRTDGDIREVVRTIVTSPEFFSRAAYRAKVKSPFELVASTMRALNAAPDPSPRTAQIVAWLGQPIFGHQAPNGWPETGEPWMNTGAILNRINFGMAAASSRLPGVSLARWPEGARLRNAPRAEQVGGVIDALLGGEASHATREILGSGVHPMLARAHADSAESMQPEPDAEPDASMADAGAPAGRRRQRSGQRFADIGELTGLAQVVGLALGSPEFQRR